MLWKKESNQTDALYVDMYATLRKDLEKELRRINRTFTYPLPVKDVAIALNNRNEGNGHFRLNKWNYAMEMYNESLRFAKPGSEHISLAYANRSTCFLKLNMYDKCLKDIELAKEAGYPAHLVHKLESRKAVCMKRLEDGAESQKIGGQLSYDADKSFPSMANVLKVQTDNDGNAIVVANQDIDVDKTIVVEDVMFPFALKRYGLQCHICTKRCENFVPCETCAVALFCPACKGHFLHKYECGLSFCGQSSCNYEVMAEVRNIFLTINMFPSIDDLMIFIEQIRNEPKKLPMSLITDQDKLRAFFNRPLNKEYEKTDDFFPFMNYPVYQTVLKVPEIKAMFQSQKHLRFLMHLIGHYSLLLSRHSVYTVLLQPVPPMRDDDSPLVFAYGYNLIDSYLQHSCYPNVLGVLGNGQNTLVTVRPIKKGDMIFKSLIPIVTEPTEVRQEKLLESINKNCICSRCRGVRADAAQRHQLSIEPAYRSLTMKTTTSSLATFSNRDAGVKTEEAIQYCVMLLQKYGHLEWCEEIKEILSSYQDLLYRRVIESSK